MVAQLDRKYLVVVYDTQVKLSVELYFSNGVCFSFLSVLVLVGSFSLKAEGSSCFAAKSNY